MTAIHRVQHASVPAATVEPAAVGRGRWLVCAAVVAAGAGLLVIVAGPDGPLPWRAARSATVIVTTAGAFGLLRSRSGPATAVTTLAFGACTTAIGTGIGLPHLAKAGPLAPTLAGLTCLVAGVVLVGSAVVTLVRAARRWRKAVVLAAVLGTFYVVMWSLAQAVAATNVPRTAIGDTTPADAGLPFQDVEFDTDDGVSLSGWYIPSVNGAAVVLLHGAGSTRSGVLDHAEVLARNGYGVVLFDARGHGRSGGRAMDFGWYGDDDTSAAVTFLEAQPDVDDERIAAIGMSMGAEEAIGAAAADVRIRAVVAEGATTRVAGDTAWLSHEHGWRGAIQEGINWLTTRVTDLLTAADPPMTLHDAVAAIAPRPVLLIAAGAEAEEGGAGRHIASASPATVALWIVPDTGHTDALATHPEEWTERVTDFLGAALAVDEGVDVAG